MNKYLVTFTDVIIDSDYSYPNISDEIFFGVDEDDVKTQFKEMYKNSEFRKYYIDEIEEIILCSESMDSLDF